MEEQDITKDDIDNAVVRLHALLAEEEVRWRERGAANDLAWASVQATLYIALTERVALMAKDTGHFAIGMKQALHDIAQAGITAVCLVEEQLGPKRTRH